MIRSLPFRIPRGAMALAMASLLLAATSACSSPAEGNPAPSASESDSPASASVLQVGTDATYAPYEYKEGGEYVGLEPDLARAIGRQVGMDVVFEDVKFAVVGGAVKTGRFNIAMIAGTDTPDWRKEFHVIDEFRAPQGLIVPSGNPNGFGTMASLCGHKVVTFAASPSFEDPLRAASAKCGDNPIQISTLSDANGPYAAVQSGRADAFFGDFVQSTVQAKQMGAEAIEVTDGTKNLVGFIVAKDKPELAQKLACGLQKVVDSGDAAKIAAKYGIADSVILKKITIGAGETPLSC